MKRGFQRGGGVSRAAVLVCPASISGLDYGSEKAAVRSTGAAAAGCARRQAEQHPAVGASGGGAQLANAGKPGTPRESGATRRLRGAASVAARCALPLPALQPAPSPRCAFTSSFSTSIHG